MAPEDVAGAKQRLPRHTSELGHALIGFDIIPGTIFNGWSLRLDLAPPPRGVQRV